MRFLSAIIDALAAFVQRNPLMVLLLFVLALFAPALVKGIAVFILYALMGIVLAAVLLAVLLRWRIRRVRREMEEQFRGFRSGDDPFSGMSSDPFSGGRRASRAVHGSSRCIARPTHLASGWRPTWATMWSSRRPGNDESGREYENLTIENSECLCFVFLHR